ncbi:TetR/AcrR family transcriptional regulator [Gordonia sp. PS3]|uniref:TetR/AcrR family transcriptional regulator n=1 Tax=Gordonia TaxID=2053 RepID=UPI0005EF7DA0|nr:MULTISPECIES: helix-turn-helix domain-containing protein [Gordonia]KJR09144.1 TetR family transcriptional regulator [Gordonia sihwensis]KXT55810.1 TetR family transcriptional regulator [Gordonia sp. QH-12]
MATLPVRDRLLLSATQLLRSKGADGFGMSELMEHSGVARRSMYQHFPRGKAQLLEQATDEAGRHASSRLAAALYGRTAVEGLIVIVDEWKQTLVRHDYRLGCPLVAASTSAAEYPGAAERAATAFQTLAGQIAASFEADGLAADAARRAGDMLVAALEGAIITSRATRSTAPLDALSSHIRETWG